jgi:hypothetical protein
MYLYIKTEIIYLCLLWLAACFASRENTPLPPAPGKPHTAGKLNASPGKKTAECR